MNTVVNQNLWDRQQEELDVAWASFQRYRDLPVPRPPLKDFAEAIGRSPGLMRSWAQLWGWDARLLAWDQHLDSARQKVTLTSVEEMAVRHIELAQMAQGIVLKAMKTMLEDVEKFGGRLKAQEIARLLDVSAKLERLSRGEATERVEGQDFSKLTDADLAQLEEIYKKAK